MKYTQRGFIVQGVIAVVALVLIATGAYYVSQKKISAPAAEDIDTTTIDTSGLEMYISEKFGFSFQYPNHWTTKILRSDPSGDFIIVGFIDTTTNKQLMSISNPIREIGYEFMVATGTSRSFLVKEGNKNIMIASFVDEENPEILYTHLTWGEDDWMKSGEIWFSLPAGEKNSEKTIELILSTFKFTSPSPKISITNDSVVIGNFMGYYFTYEVPDNEMFQGGTCRVFKATSGHQALMEWYSDQGDGKNVEIPLNISKLSAADKATLEKSTQEKPIKITLQKEKVIGRDTPSCFSTVKILKIGDKIITN